MRHTNEEKPANELATANGRYRIRWFRVGDKWGWDFRCRAPWCERNGREDTESMAKKAAEAVLAPYLLADEGQ